MNPLQDTSIVHVLRRRAQKAGDQIALTHLNGSLEDQTHITVAELDARARMLAVKMLAEGLTGERVLLLFPPDIEFIVGFFACLYAGAIAVPAYPPDPSRLARTLPRLRGIVKDAGCVAVLTTRFISGLAQALGTVAPELVALSWIATDADPGFQPEDWCDPGLSPETPAFLQYTSGSTAAPKGVIVTHGNLYAHQISVTRQLGTGLPHDVFVSWLPTYHDMGLIGGLLHPLCTGYRCIFMPPMAFLRNPYLWLQAISHFRGTITVAPDFAYQLCLRKVTPAQRDALDLSCWDLALSGAEPVRWETLRDFSDYYGPVGFKNEAWYPTYGLAEATLMVAGYRRVEAPHLLHVSTPALAELRVERAAPTPDGSTQVLVGCGRAVVHVDIAIVDPTSRRRCAADQVGEIWVRGPIVAQGYWKQPALTQEVFRARVEGEDGEWMRTGDLGWLDGDQLYVAGRIKDVIIHAGLNFYPQDIEVTASAAHAAVRPGCAAAVSLDLGGREISALIVEVDPKEFAEPSEVLSVLRRELSAAHELPLHAIVLIAPRTIPKTTSGKIQRRRAAQSLDGLKLDVIDANVLSAPGDGGAPLSAWLSALPASGRPAALRQAVESILAELAAAPVPIDDEPLSARGLGLAHMLRLQESVLARAGLELPWKLLLSAPTGAGIAAALHDRLDEIVAPRRAEPGPRDKANIEAWLLKTVASRTGRPVADVGLDAPFAELGLDSSAAVELASALELWLRRPIPATALWDYGTIGALAAFLASGGDKARPPEPARASNEDAIAVVGLALRFPGADDPRAFWELLRDGRDAVREVPEQRWDVAALEARLPDGIGIDMIRWGGFLEDIDCFDPAVFGLSEREAPFMDPQQRLLLELTWQALESAGIPRERLAGSSTGVFVGMSSDDYSSLQLADPDGMSIHACTGSSRSIASNRISYLFDLHGPSETVDTACSSSLVAVVRAVQAMRSGECQMALVGGVNLIIRPELSVGFAGAGMLAADGRCKTFDASADGYVRGEGAAVLVLKPYSAAQADGDRVLGLIRGVATNHSGRSNGLTAPNGAAQTQVIRAALADGGLGPDDLDYVEAHGTGTPLGDPIELRALSRALEGRRRPPVAVGSVKTNIGHLEGAAGIAGLIKVLLSLEHGEISPHLNLSEVNPQVDLAALGLAISVERRPWPSVTGRPRRAGVSSFGFGGANAHVVVEQAPASDNSRAIGRMLHVLKVSAVSAEAVGAQCSRLAEALDTLESSVVEAVSTLNLGRSDLSWRAAVVGKDAAELAANLREVASMGLGRRAPATPPRVVFVFAGQGSQHEGMGRELYQAEPAFRAALDRCSAAFERAGGPSLVRLILDDGAKLDETYYAQMALFGFSYAIAALWRAWGVEPAYVLGHSVGEIAAACVAGGLDLDAAAALMVRRARLVQDLPEGGGMLGCTGPVAALKQAISSLPSEVELAARNSPDRIVLSGPVDALDRVAKALERRGVRTTRLRVTRAQHSRAVEPVVSPLIETAARLASLPLQIPLVSTATGRVHAVGESLGAEHWGRHIRDTVRFDDALRAAISDGGGLILDLGPDGTLTALAQHTAGELGVPLVTTVKNRRQVLDGVMSAAGSLYCAGVAPDWVRVSGGVMARGAVLPGYAFQRRRYWHAPGESLSPLAGHRARLADKAPDTPYIQQGSGEARPQDLTAVVLRAVERVGAFSPGRVGPLDQLVGDLGFDSLMINELIGRLGAIFPGVDSEPLEQLRDPSVQGIVDALEGLLPKGHVAPVVHLPDPVRASPTAVPEEGSFADWPEVAAFRARLRVAEADGSNPYGRVHESMNNGVVSIGGRVHTNFASFNYLGLSANAIVCKRTKAAIDQYGTSASATPLLLGETPMHLELEREIAEFLGTDAAIVFASGHQTNVATIGHLFGPGDLILHDSYIHDSAIRGAILSQASRRSFPHGDYKALDAMLTRLRSDFRRVVILLEGVYSQDGDICNLPPFIEVKRRHGALLMIDEAHSIGVLGRTGAGIGEHHRVNRADVDLWMGTLSKALGSCGGYIAASADLIQYLKFTTPLFIFSTGMSPANVAAALASIRVLREQPELVERLRDNAAFFLREARARGLDTGVADGTGIVPVIIGSWERTIRLSNAMLAQGVNVMPIGYPAVPADAARLRFFMCSDHARGQLVRSLDTLVALLANEENGLKPAEGHSHG